jgi:hypothetical protein
LTLAGSALGGPYGLKDGFRGLQAVYPAGNPVAAVFWPNAAPFCGRCTHAEALGVELHAGHGALLGPQAPRSREGG